MSDATVIKPTIGRVVWFYEPHEQAGAEKAAIVCHVWGDSVVNLTVFEPDGRTTPRLNVTLCQENEKLDSSVPHCRWMPYQIGQAKKHQETSA